MWISNVLLTATELIAAVAFLVTAAWYLVRHYKVRILPPGPLGAPFVGNLPMMMDSPNSSCQFKLLRTGKLYGGMFTFYIGRFPTVWITSYKLFHEAMVTRGWDCASRPPELPLKNLDPSGKGYQNIAHGGVDAVDKEIRDFVLTKLKTFGFDQNKMQTRILEEADYVVRELSRHSGTAFNPTELCQKASANISFSVLFGRRFEYDDQEIQTVLQKFSDAVRMLMKVKLDEAFPILKLFPRKCRKECYDNYNRCTIFLTKIVQENKLTWQKDNPRNFMDTWMDENAKSNAATTIYDLDRLPLVLWALFLASYDTTTVTLTWIFALLLNRPDIQSKVQAELDKTVISGDVTLAHREALPYTESVILETMRMYPAAPFAIPHYTNNDTIIGSYKIPKGTRIGVHLFSIHYDESLWTDPYRFRPERFIVNGTIHVPEYFVLFSQGRRACMGEKLARKQIFLLLANILQKLSIYPLSPNEVPSLDFVTRGLVMHPAPFEMKVRPRPWHEKP